MILTSPSPAREEGEKHKALSGHLVSACFSPFRFINRSSLHFLTHCTHFDCPEEGSAGSSPALQESYISILNSFTLLFVLGFVFTVLEGSMSTGDTVRIHRRPKRSEAFHWLQSMHTCLVSLVCKRCRSDADYTHEQHIVGFARYLRNAVFETRHLLVSIKQLSKA